MMNEKINKPITLVVKETKKKIADACNESGLPPVILDLIVQGIYSEIHLIAEQQTLADEKSYMDAVSVVKEEGVE